MHASGVGAAKANPDANTMNLLNYLKQHKMESNERQETQTKATWSATDVIIKLTVMQVHVNVSPLVTLR